MVSLVPWTQIVLLSWAFSVLGPRLCSLLLNLIYSVSSSMPFRSTLKTHLFDLLTLHTIQYPIQLSWKVWPWTISRMADDLQLLCTWSVPALHSLSSGFSDLMKFNLAYDFLGWFHLRQPSTDASGIMIHKATQVNTLHLYYNKTAYVSRYTNPVSGPL